MRGSIMCTLQAAQNAAGYLRRGRNTRKIFYRLRQVSEFRAA